MSLSIWLFTDSGTSSNQARQLEWNIQIHALYTRTYLPVHYDTQCHSNQTKHHCSLQHWGYIWSPFSPSDSRAFGLWVAHWVIWSIIPNQLIKSTIRYSITGHDITVKNFLTTTFWILFKTSDWNFSVTVHHQTMKSAMSPLHTAQPSKPDRNGLARLQIFPHSPVIY